MQTQFAARAVPVALPFTLHRFDLVGTVIFFGDFMGIFSSARQLKTQINYGSRLFLIRLRMLRLDLIAQVRSTLSLLAAIAAIAVFFLLGFVCLVFALNRLLPDTAAVWVFLGLTVIFLALAGLLAVWAAVLLKRQGTFMEETLNAVADDMAFISETGTGKTGKDNEANGKRP